MNPEFTEEELHERVRLNQDIARLIITNRFVPLDELNRCLKQLEKERLNGQLPPSLIDFLLEKQLLAVEQKRALDIAADRFERERETSQFKLRGYKLTRKIGSGGLGVVCQGWQISMKRPVAIKILHDKWANDSEFRNRFILEARVMGRLSHQNLIQVYDVGREGGILYFSMEYIEGPTVEDLIRRGGGLDPVEALDISLQVLRAIHYIAGFDIVHRDIKPANILMNSNNIAKLGDFGFLFSKHEQQLAQDGYVIGTPDYISPEQVSGKKVDFRSDVYSLGVCLYHMLSGDLPYHGSVSAVMRQHLSGDLPERIPEKGRRIPAEIYNVVCKMMAKDPQDRYAEIKTLMDELQYLKANEIMKTKGGAGSSADSSTFQPPVPPPSLAAAAAPDPVPPAVDEQQFIRLKDQNRMLFSMLVSALGLCVLLGLLLLSRW